MSAQVGKKPRKKSRRRWLIAVGVVVGILVVMGVIGQIVGPGKTFDASQFSQFINIHPSVGSYIGPAIVGKIVVIDEDKKAVSSVNSNNALDAIRANNPGEVGTIIQISCVEQEIGYWTNGATAYATHCWLTAINRAENLASGTTDIWGPGLDENKTYSGDAHLGPPSDDDLAKAILSMSRT